MARVMSMPVPIPQATMHNTSYDHIEAPSTSLAQRRQLRHMQVDVPSSSFRSTESELWSHTQSAYFAYASASNYVQTTPQTPRLGRASSTPPPAPCKSRRRNRVEMQHGDEIQPSRRLRF